MPIYEQSYRKYDARGPLRKVRFWPITREALVLVLKRRAYIGLMILAGLPMVVRMIQVYIVTQFAPAAGRILSMDATLFGQFLNQQIGFAILLSVFGGAGLIANDLRTGAILVYLSRPLTRRDYVIGKLCVLLAVNLAVTLVPAIALYLTALSLAPDKFRTFELAWILPAIVLHSFVISLVISLVALAVSSLSKSARLAGLGFVMLFVGLEIVRAVVRSMTKVKEAGLISLQADLKAIGSAIFGNVERGAPPGWVLPALVLVTTAAICLLVLRRRVRAVEVVS
jgi:ABC-2 type transport system permease protein